MHAVHVKIKILNPLLIFINKKRLELNCFHEFMPFSTMASKHEQKQKQTISKFSKIGPSLI